MSEQQNQGAVQGYLQSLPSWAKSLVALLTVPPLALAITGMLLNVNVGTQLDKYMDLYFAQQMKATENSADRVIYAVDEKFEAMNARIDELTKSVGAVANTVDGLETRVDALEYWACDHSAVQGLRQDAPEFCEGMYP